MPAPPSTSLIPRAGESVAAIDTVVITHQHGDHTFGLPFFLAARAIDHPEAPPLTIVTPPGFTAYLEQLFDLAWGPRLRDLVMDNSHPTFIEVDGGESIELPGLHLQAERMVHVPEIPCLGYAFRDGQMSASPSRVTASRARGLRLWSRSRTTCWSR